MDEKVKKKIKLIALGIGLITLVAGFLIFCLGEVKGLINPEEYEGVKIYYSGPNTYTSVGPGVDIVSSGESIGYKVNMTLPTVRSVISDCLFYGVTPAIIMTLLSYWLMIKLY